MANAPRQAGNHPRAGDLLALVHEMRTRGELWTPCRVSQRVHSARGETRGPKYPRFLQPLGYPDCPDARYDAHTGHPFKTRKGAAYCAKSTGRVDWTPREGHPRGKTSEPGGHLDPDREWEM